MTSYNYSEFISEAIESVINQSVSAWELIIVDDGSVDNSIEIIENFCKKDERIKLFTHSEHENLGLKKSILLGLEKSQGDWVAFLESDDYLELNYLEEKFAVLAKFPQTKFIYNDVNIFGCENHLNEKYMQWVKDLWKDCEEPKDVFELFGDRNIVPTFSCVMCDKKTLLGCDFDTPCEPILDYWLWWQIAQDNNFCFIYKKLTNWRQHKKSYFLSAPKYFKYYLSRSSFVPDIAKKMARKVNVVGKNRFEKYKFFSVLKYTLLYLRRKSTFFKKIFTNGK